MSRGRSAATRLTLAATALAVAGSTTLVTPVLAGSLAAQAEATAGGSLSAAATPSWQTNAEVRQMVYAGGDVYLVGAFTSMRPPGYARGHHETPATSFAAISAKTGALDTAVMHTHSFSGGGMTAAGEVFAVAASPDQKTIYVGGNFTTIDGEFTRYHVAAFNASNGALLPWDPDVHGKVSTIATAADTVYLGGTFTAVNTVARSNLAAVTASTGDLVSNWAPGTNDTVDALAVTADNSTVIAGGYFDQVDGLTESEDGSTPYNKAVILAGENASSPGAREPMPADSVVPVGTTQSNLHNCISNVKDIIISGTSAYLANEGTGSRCFDGTWGVSLTKAGSLEWVNRCLGATQSLAVVGNYLYKASHAHDCQAMNTNHDPANFPQVPTGGARHLLSENLTNGFLGPWYPIMNAGPALGPRTLVTDGKQLYVGGDFTMVDHKGQQGIARFTTSPNYPTPAPAKPVVSSARPGTVSVTATAPVDLDDPTLTMELFKVGSAKPLATQTVTSYFWKKPSVHFVKTGLSQDSNQSFTVRAVAAGESPGAMSRATSVRVACATHAKVRAALRSVKAARQKSGARQVDIQVCVGTLVSAHLELRKNDRVVARKFRHLHVGLRTVHLAIPKRFLAGRYEARVVFVRGTERKTQDKVVHLAR
jgi:hypothetical protein